jgi:ribonuclease VapC
LILDSSAVVALLLNEPVAPLLLNQIASAEQLGIGAPTLAECGIVLTVRWRRSAQADLRRFLEESSALVIPFQDAHGVEAVQAFLRFGKGRHPAALNFGDCMTYAVAKLAGRPLLCTGDDFRKTDLTLA